MTTHDEPMRLPDRSPGWRPSMTSVRPFIGWILVGLGALAIFLAWYGVSGQSLTAKQIPYAVSGGFTGIGLIVVAAVFLSADDRQRQLGRLDEIERKVDDLYSLLVTDEPTATADASGATLVAVPRGSTYHLPQCTLVAGKAEVAVVSAAAIRERSLLPCRVCDPLPLDASG